MSNKSKYYYGGASTETVVGLKELEDALRKLAPMIVGLKGYPQNALRNAARDAAKVAEDDAANRVHHLRQLEPKKGQTPYKRTGRLEDAITVKIMGVRYRDKATLGGNSKEYFYVGAKSGKSKNDPNGAYYTRFVEQGTDKMPARPFLRPAVENNKAKIINTFQSKLRKDLLKIAKKIGDENTRDLLMKGVK